MASNRFVQNALMDMYARLGDMDAARRIFPAIHPRDVVSWNTLIAGCVVQGRMDDAFQLVREMQQQGRLVTTNAATEDGEEKQQLVMPNNITLMTLLPGCAMLAAPARRREIHGYALRHALDSDVAVGSALVDMYAKCGSLALSRAVFDRLPRRNVITSNVLVMAYGMHGLGATRSPSSPLRSTSSAGRAGWTRPTGSSRPWSQGSSKCPRGAACSERAACTGTSSSGRSPASGCWSSTPTRPATTCSSATSTPPPACGRSRWR
jgi:pentatricopeptide repeat protein